jgi:hypothetical protein
MSMKVYTKVVWEWQNGVLVPLEEHYYHYDGPIAWAGGGTPVTVQDHFRIRSDTTAANPGTPVWVTTEDQANSPTSCLTYPLDTSFRIRFVISNTGTGDQTANFGLMFSQNGGAYTNINIISNTTQPVRAADASSDVTATALTTANFQLSAGSGTAANGQYVEANQITPTLALGTYQELEYGILFNSTASTPAVNGDTFDFRIYLNSSTPFDTYTVTPRVTVGAAAANFILGQICT